jgi:hypothetical protein
MRTVSLTRKYYHEEPCRGTKMYFYYRGLDIFVKSKNHPQNITRENPEIRRVS